MRTEEFEQTSNLSRLKDSLQLHPSALVGLEPAVELDGGVDVRRAVAGHVEHGRAEGARRAQHGLPVGRHLPADKYRLPTLLKSSSGFFRPSNIKNEIKNPDLIAIILDLFKVTTSDVGTVAARP